MVAGNAGRENTDRLESRSETRSCEPRRAPEERAPEDYSTVFEERSDEAARRRPQMRVAVGFSSRSVF
jgi:hypothetical protein